MLAEGVASNLKLVHAAVNLLLHVQIVPQSRLAIKHSVRPCPVGTLLPTARCTPSLSACSSPSASLSLSHRRRRGDTNWYLDRAFELTFLFSLLLSHLFRVHRQGGEDMEKEAGRNAIKKNLFPPPEWAVDHLDWGLARKKHRSQLS